jgi:hypothetical protein
MKKFLCKTLLFVSTFLPFSCLLAQNDAMVVNANITNEKDELLNVDELKKGQVVKFNITLMNPNENENIKANSCELRIDLNNKMKLVKDFDFKTMMPFAAYFNWELVTEKTGASYISGKLIADLPPDMLAPTFINFECAEKGKGLIKVFWIYDYKQNAKSPETQLSFTIK